MNFYNPYMPQQYLTPQQSTPSLPAQQILKVNGEESVRQVRMAPNSSALAMRDEYPEIAEHMYKRSLEEKAHADGLHKDVVKIIEAYRAEKGDPPADMMAVYNYLHKQHIDAYSKAVAYQNQYKDS